MLFCCNCCLACSDVSSIQIRDAPFVETPKDSVDEEARVGMSYNLEMNEEMYHIMSENAFTFEIH